MHCTNLDGDSSEQFRTSTTSTGTSTSTCIFTFLILHWWGLYIHVCERGIGEGVGSNPQSCPQTPPSHKEKQSGELS